MANTPNSLFNTDLFNNNLFNGNIDLSNPLDISKNLEGLPQVGITVTPPTKSSGATDLKTVVDQNEVLANVYEENDKKKRSKNKEEKVDVQVEERINKVIKNLSPWEGDRVQREFDLRQEYTRLINEHPEQKDALLDDLQVKLNAINEERELEKQGIRPNRPLNINPNDPFSPNFSIPEQKIYDATASLRDKWDWMHSALNTKVRDLHGYTEGEFELSDSDSGVIKGIFGDTPFRLTSFNPQHESNGIFDAVDEFDHAVMNPNKYATQSVFVHKMLGKDIKEKIKREEWNAVKAYGLYLTAKYVNGELKEYEPFNLNKVDEYKEYFETHKKFKGFYKDYGKDTFNRTLIDIANDKGESYVIGLTFNPLINSAFRTDKATDYIEASHRLTEALYAKQERMIEREKKIAQDTKDTDWWFGEKIDLLQKRAFQVFASIPAMFDVSEKFISEYILGKHAGAFRDLVNDEDKLNAMFGVRNDTWYNFQNDMQRAQQEFAKGNYLISAAIYASNAANLIITSAPDMAATIGLTALLGPVGTALGVTGKTGYGLLNLYARSFIAGSLISGTAQTVADMHQFEVNNGRPMNMQELWRTWGMNGIGMSLEGILGGGMLGRIFPFAPNYLIATPRRLLGRTLGSMGLNIIEEAGTEAVQEYIQNSISAANVAGGDYTQALLANFADWKTQGANALAGAITGGIMSAGSHVFVINKVRDQMKNQQKWFDTYDTRGAITLEFGDDMDAIAKYLNEHPEANFNKEQIEKSHEYAKSIQAQANGLIDTIKDGTFNESMSSILAKFGKMQTEYHMQMTCKDYMETLQAINNAENLAFKQHFNNAKGNRQEIEKLARETIISLFPNTKDQEKIFSRKDLQYELDLIFREFTSGVLRSSPSYISYLIATGAPVTTKKLFGEFLVLEPEYKQLKDLKALLSNQPLDQYTDENFLKDMGELSKNTDEVYEDFMTLSTQGHSIFQITRDIYNAKEAYEDCLNSMRGFFAALPPSALQITVNGGTNTVTDTELLDNVSIEPNGVYTQWAQTVDKQYFNGNGALLNVVLLANHLAKEQESLFSRMTMLETHHVNKYVTFGTELEKGADASTIVVNYRSPSGRQSQFTITQSALADESSARNKVLNNIKLECEAIIDREQDLADLLYATSRPVAYQNMLAALENDRIKLKEAEAKINVYRQNALMKSQKMLPTNEKTARIAAPFLRRLFIPFLMSANKNCAQAYLTPFALEFYQETQNRFKGKKLEDLTEAQKDDCRSALIKCKDDAALDKKSKNNQTFRTIRTNYFSIINTFNDGISTNNYQKGKLTNLLRNLTSANLASSVYNQAKTGTLAYFEGGARTPQKLDANTQTFMMDIREAWLSLTDRQRQEIWNEWLRVKAEFDLVDDGVNTEATLRDDFATNDPLKSILTNIFTLIEKDNWLNSKLTIDGTYQKEDWHYNASVNFTSYIGNLEDSSKLTAVFNDETFFPKPKVININYETDFRNFMAYLAASPVHKNDIKVVKIGDYTRYVITKQKLLECLDENQATFTYKNTGSGSTSNIAAPMYKGVINLYGKPNGEYYTFTLKTNENTDEYVIADTADITTLVNAVDSHYKNVDTDLNLSITDPNSNVKLTFSRTDGKTFKVDFGNAILLCQEFTDGTKAVDVLNEIDPTLTGEAFTRALATKLKELQDKKTVKDYAFNGTIFTQQEHKDHEFLFLDFLYMQALKDSNIDISQHVKPNQVIFTRQDRPAIAEMVARALAFQQKGKTTATKEELIASYGEEKEGLYTTPGYESNTNTQEKTVPFDQNILAGKMDDVLVLGDEPNALREAIKSGLRPFFVAPTIRTYRGLNFEVMSQVIDVMTDDEVANFYFLLKDKEANGDGLVPLEEYFIHSTKDPKSLREEFWIRYDKNIDEIVSINFVSEILDRYGYGSTNQALHDFNHKYDIDLFEHTFDYDTKYDSTIGKFLNVLKSRVSPSADLRKIIRILEVLTSTNFKKKVGGALDPDAEAYIKGYYWLQLQQAYRDGTFDTVQGHSAIWKELQKDSITEDKTKNQNESVTITLSDGTTRKIYNPVNYVSNGITLQHGMDVQDLQKAGFSVTPIKQTANNNAIYENSVVQFYSPIIDGAEKTIYIVQANNRAYTATKTLTLFHKAIQDAIKNNKQYQGSRNNISLKDAIQELYDDRIMNPQEKLSRMIQKLYKFGMPVNEIDTLLNIYRQDNYDITLCEPTNIRLGDLLAIDSTTNQYAKDANENFILKDEYKDLINLTASTLNVNGQDFTFKEILNLIVKNNATDYADITIKSLDRLGFSIKNNNTSFDIVKASAIIDTIEPPANLKVTLQSKATQTYAPGSLLKDLTDNLNKPLTGKGVITIDEEFLDIIESSYQGSYKSSYGDAFNTSQELQDLQDFLYDLHIINTNNTLQARDTLIKAIPNITYNRKTNTYYINRKPVNRKYAGMAEFLYNKKKKFEKKNSIIIGHTKEFLDAFLLQLQNQGVKEIDFVVNITVPGVRELVENQLITPYTNSSGGIKIELIKNTNLNSELSDDTIVNFLAGTGISLAKVKKKYNYTTRKIINAMLGNGLAENEADFVIALGGFNPYLATALGDRFAMTGGLYKTYIDDETEEKFTQEFEDEVTNNGMKSDDSYYIGMTSEDDEKLYVDTSDAFELALRPYVGNLKTGSNPDILAAVNNLLSTKDPTGLGAKVKELSTRRTHDPRGYLHEKQNLKRLIMTESKKGNITTQNIYDAISAVCNTAKLNTFDPTDQNNSALSRYLYYCIKDNTGIYVGLQNALVNNKGDLYFTAEKFIQDKNFQLQQNATNTLDTIDFQVLSALLDYKWTISKQETLVNGSKTTVLNPYTLILYYTNKKDGTKAPNVFIIADKNDNNINTPRYMVEAATVLKNWSNKHQNMLEATKAGSWLFNQHAAELNNVHTIQEATALINKYWTEMQNARAQKSAKFNDMGKMQNALQSKQNKQKALSAVDDKINWNFELQKEIKEIQKIITSNNLNPNNNPNNIFTIHQQYLNGLQQLYFSSKDLARDLRNEKNQLDAQPNASFETKLKHNGAVQKLQNYFYTYDSNNISTAKALNTEFIKIDDTQEFDNQADVKAIHDRIERELKANELKQARASVKKSLQTLEKAINDAKTDEEKDIAWNEYINFIEGGLSNATKTAKDLISEIRKKIKLLDKKELILNEAPNLTNNIIESLKDNGFAEDNFGHYQELISKVTDTALRERIEKVVDKVALESSITLNFTEGNMKIKQLHGTVQREILVFLNDLGEDIFTPKFRNEVRNKINLGTLTNNEALQILALMIEKNPTLLLLYDAHIDSTGTIRLEMKKEAILGAIASGSQTIDQFSSLTEKDADDMLRILGIQSKGDMTVATAKLQKMINQYGATRMSVWRAFGNAWLETMSVRYSNNDPNSPAFAKDGLVDGLGRFVMDSLLAVNNDIVEADDSANPRAGKKISKEALEVIFGEKPKHDVSFYKFDSKKIGEVKGLGDVLAVDVFNSVGRETQVFSFDKAIKNELKNPRGSDFRPVVYETDTFGNIRYKDGKPIVLTQLSGDTVGMLNALNNTPFILTNRNFDLLNDICDNSAAYLRGYGYHSMEELNNMTEYERLAAIGQNNSIIQQIEVAKVLRDQIIAYQQEHNTTDIPKIYFDWEQIVSGRFQLKGSLFNVQNNKVLRGLLVAEGTYREFDLNDPKVLEKELFAFCQGFDCLGASKRNGVRQLIKDADLDMAKRLEKSVLTLDDASFEAMWSHYGLGIEERTLALQVAHYLVLRCEAKKAGKTKFMANLMVEDDSTTSGYFLKILLFPHQKILKDYAIKVGVFDEGTRKVAEGLYGIDYKNVDDVPDIDYLKKLSFFQDIYRQTAITTDAIIQDDDTMDRLLKDVDSNGNLIDRVKDALLSKVNGGILQSITIDDGSVLGRKKFIASLPHVGTNADGIPEVSKEFREMLKPITMVFSYGAGHNRIVSQTADTLYDMISTELKKIAYFKNVRTNQQAFVEHIKDYVSNLSSDEISKLAPKARLFAYNITLSDHEGTNTDYKLGFVDMKEQSRLTKEQKDSISKPDFVINPTFIDENAFSDITQEQLYKDLIAYGYFYSSAVQGIESKTAKKTITNPITGITTEYPGVATYNPEDILVFVREQQDKSNPSAKTKKIYLSYDQAIKNVLGITYGEAVYEGLKKDFGPFMQINDAINTMAAIQTEIFKNAYNKELDVALIKVNSKLRGMSTEDKDYDKERGKALSRLTKKDVNDILLNLVKKNIFPTGPSAATILGMHSQADRYLQNQGSLLGGIQILERDPVNTLFDKITQVFTQDAEHGYKVESYSLYSLMDQVGQSGLRTAVSTIHSSDAYVLSRTIQEAFKLGIHATPIHDALFMSALDQDTLGNLYNQAALDMGAKFSILQTYVEWFENNLRAGGYTQDILKAQGNQAKAYEYKQLRYLAEHGNTDAIRRLQSLEGSILKDQQGNFLGTRLNAFHLNNIQAESIKELIGKKEALQEARGDEVLANITLADILSKIYDIRDMYDNSITGYRAKFYAGDVYDFNLAGQGVMGYRKGKGKKVLASNPNWNPTNNPAANSVIKLAAADSTKAGILHLLDELGTGEDLAYVKRLHDLIDQFMDVDTLLGWIVSRQYIQGNTVGTTDFTNKVITIYQQGPSNVATGYHQSSVEVYAHELIHALFDFAFNNQQNPEVATAIAKLRLLREYVIKNKLITENDFYDATGYNVKDADQRAKEEAKKFYDYLFDEKLTDAEKAERSKLSVDEQKAFDQQHIDRSLKEFLSFILTNPTLFNKLEKAPIKVKSKKSVLALIFDIVSKLFKTIFGKMKTDVAFQDIVDQLAGTMLNNNDTVYETAVKLCLDIQKANGKAQTLLQKAQGASEVATDFVNSVRDAGNHLVNPLLKQFSNIPGLAVKLGSGSKAAVAAKLLAFAPFNKDVRNGLHSYLSMLGTELTGGYLNDLINDLKSSDDYTFSLAKAERRAQQIDGIEQRAEDLLNKKLREEFKTGEHGETLPDLTLAEEDALSVLVRGNVQCFLSDKENAATADEVKSLQENLLSNQEYRNHVEDNILHNDYPDKLTHEQQVGLTRFIKNLALYESAIMLNAKGTMLFSSYDCGKTMILKSRRSLRENLGIYFEDSFVDKLAQKVDKLATIYYINKLVSSNSNKVETCARLNPKGVQAYVMLHKHFRKVADERNKNGSMTQLECQKEIGIVPAARNFFGNPSIQFQPLKKKAVMEHNGYKLLNSKAMVNSTSDRSITFKGMVANSEYGMFLRDLNVPGRIDGSSISTNALKDQSISLDKVLTDSYDLEVDVEEALKQEVAQGYSTFTNMEQEDILNMKTRDYKKALVYNYYENYRNRMLQDFVENEHTYDEFDNAIRTSYYDGGRLRPYNYEDSITLLNMDDNGIKLLSKMEATQAVASESFAENKALVCILNAYFDENAIAYGIGKFRDKNNKLFFLDIKNELIKRFGSSVTEALKDQDHFYVREDMVKAVLGVESWSITEWKKADGETNVIPPSMRKAAVYVESLMKLFGFKAKENVVVRNPKVLFDNVVSNINIHLLTESNLPKVMQMYAKNTQSTYNYLHNEKRKMELEYKQNIKTITEDETRELHRIESALKNSPVRVLMESGMFTNIIEDLTTLQQENMQDITTMLANTKIIKNIPEAGKNAFKQIYMLKGTPIFDLMYRINQYSDFVARVTEYQIQMERCPYNKDKEYQSYERYEKKVLNDLWDKFIDYRVPVNRVEQYLNDVGFINFAKYFRRIQRVIGKQVINNPVGCLMQLARQFALKGVGLETENIFSSNIFSKNYDALLLGPEKAVYNTALPGIFHFFGIMKYKNN